MDGLLVRWRWGAWLLIVVLAWVSWEPGGGVDLYYFANAGRTLVSHHAVRGNFDGQAQFGPLAGGLHVFAHGDGYHFGPLAALAGLAAPHVDASGIAGLAVLDTAMLLVVVAVVDGRCRRGPGASASTLIVPVLLVTGLWASLHWSHPDVVGAATGVFLCAVAARDGHARRAGAWLAVALLFSQVAVLALPALLGIIGWRRRGEAVGVMVGLTALAWAPFVIVDRRTTDAWQATDVVDVGSLLRVLGVEAGTSPGWVRPVQLVLCVVVSASCLRSKRVGPVLVGAMSVRLLIDPSPLLRSLRPARRRDRLRRPGGGALQTRLEHVGRGSAGPRRRHQQREQLRRVGDRRPISGHDADRGRLPVRPGRTWEAVPACRSVAGRREGSRLERW